MEAACNITSRTWYFWKQQGKKVSNRQLNNFRFPDLWKKMYSIVNFLIWVRKDKISETTLVTTAPYEQSKWKLLRTFVTLLLSRRVTFFVDDSFRLIQLPWTDPAGNYLSAEMKWYTIPDYENTKQRFSRSLLELHIRWEHTVSHILCLSGNQYCVTSSLW